MNLAAVTGEITQSVDRGNPVAQIVGRHLSRLTKPLAEMSSAEVLLLAMQIGAEDYQARTMAIQPLGEG